MRVPRLILIEQTRRLGWPGLAGGTLLALALGYALLGLLPARQALANLDLQLAADREQLSAAASVVSSKPTSDSSSAQLEDFRRNLPAQLDATGAIDRIYALAREEGISLARGEYALGLDPKTRLARYQVLLPVRGSYPQLRRFLHGLQAQLPALALEEVDLQRKQIADSELEGRIRMTLYLAR
ncbi:MULTISPECIES: GspMb/PilO family protein [unclassified Pseudomonas]|uniref:GspMb/PilO family protein n=1 Tax=unclassified Pseudomonas TaxID=196821 RepID=UPI00129E90B8|nr:MULTISPECIES: GspMb/PilO family protein [unclassified Pseudomonas]MDH4652104.1 pilus assembly protein PilO [Pseudomonas sp. BN606]MRK22573.1 pilus assembly protein PilO [Pseudomonas sp. JG-B]